MPDADTHPHTTETEFLNDYISWLREGQYRLRYHVIDSSHHARVTSTGYPDVHAVHDDRGLLIAELKSDTGDVRDDQWDWLTTLARHLPPPNDDTAPGRVHLWWPRDETWARTQIGINPHPEPCDCPVCRHLQGLDPFDQQRKRKRPNSSPTACPICGRRANPQTIADRGDCGNCRPKDIQRYEAQIIKERLIEKVF